MAKSKKSKKSCKKGYSRNRDTGRCRKKGIRNILKKNVLEGECRGRTKKSCQTKVNCKYRKKTGCYKRQGVAKGLVYEGPEMPDAGRPRKSRKSRKSRKYGLIGGSNDGQSEDGSDDAPGLTKFLKEYINSTEATGTGNFTCNNVKVIKGVINSYGRWCKKISTAN